MRKATSHAPSTRLALGALILASVPAWAQTPSGGAPASFEYRVLATSRTSTMQKEMSDAAGAGYRFAAVLGSETAVGAETVVVMGRAIGESTARYEYKLLVTSKSSTMQKELQEAGDAGFDYRGQTVFRGAFSGREVALILERDRAAAEPKRWQYRLLATTRAATMQKELAEATNDGFEFVGVTFTQEGGAGPELVTILRRPAS